MTNNRSRLTPVGAKVREAVLRHPETPTRELVEILRAQGVEVNRQAVNSQRKALGLRLPHPRSTPRQRGTSPAQEKRKPTRKKPEPKILPENLHKNSVLVFSEPPPSMDYDAIQSLRKAGSTIVEIARFFKVDVLQVLRLEKQVENLRFLQDYAQKTGKHLVGLPRKSR